MHSCDVASQCYGILGIYISSNSILLVLEFQCSKLQKYLSFIAKKSSTLLIQIACLDASVLNIAVALQFQFYKFQYSVSRVLG